MRGKKRKNVTTKETCAFLACFLLVFFSISQILAISHRFSGINATAEKRQVDMEDGNQMTRAVAAARVRNLKLQPTSQQRTEQDQLQQQQKLSQQSQSAASLRMKNRARLQNELRRMEKSLTMLVRRNSMPPEDASAHFQTEVSVIQLKEMIRKSEDGLMKPLDFNRTDSARQFSYNSDNRTRWSDIDIGSEIYNETILFHRDRGNSDNNNNNDNNNEKMNHNINNDSVPFSLNHDLKYSPERGHGGRGIRNNIPELEQISHYEDFDKSEEFDLERTVMKGLTDANALQEERNEAGEIRVDPTMETAKWDVSKEVSLEDIQEGLTQVCKEIPEDLVGQTQYVQLDIEVDINEIIRTHSDIKDGEWKPPDCISTHRVAIIIPYRDRWSHLKVLLHYLLPVLKRQQIHFRVFVVEQFGNQTFNKGRIMNAAFREAMKQFNFHCVIFHDVDLVPEDDRNMYTCAEHPKHMSTAIDKFSYRLPYQGLVGGVLSFRAEHFQAVNGYSNMYWGWGGEDDDMTVRILHRGLRIFRPPSNVARYKMVKHGSRQLSELRLKLLRTAARRSRVEGLNNVPYELLFTHKEKLFTHFMVDVGKP